MDTLRSLLATEQWGAITPTLAAAGSPVSSSVERAIRASPFAAVAAAAAGRDLDAWLEGANPFADGSSISADGGRSSGGAAAAVAEARPAVAGISTRSSQRMLAWLRGYAALMGPLGAHRGQVGQSFIIWAGRWGSESAFGCDQSGARK
jgi:hypothetical protein